MSKTHWLLIGIVVLLFVACTSNDPTISENDIEIDTTSVQEFSFDTSSDGFEIGRFDDSSLTVADEAYQITSFSDISNHYLIGQNPDISLKNVVIEVTVTPIAGAQNNWYGIVCRADENDTGYALLISADGFWSIAKVTQSGSRQFLDYLRQWRENDTIQQNAPNTLTAYCVEDYLALYVNGKFVGEYEDDSIDRVGGVGFLAGGAEDDTVTVTFDNARISSAAKSGRPNTPIPTLGITPETTAEATEILTLEPIEVETIEPIEVPPLGATPAP